MASWLSGKQLLRLAIATTAVTLGFQSPGDALSPETAPAELTTLITEMDAAANSEALDKLLGFYSNEFSQTDGLDKADVETLLNDLWEDYSTLTYNTVLLNWETTDAGFLTETQTRIRGMKKDEGRWVHYKGSVHAQQTYEAGQLLSRDILTESSTLTSGDNPPEIQVLIPETVNATSEFGFDVIVQDPLRDDILLGGALEEVITPATYLTPKEFDLDILPGGGVFKRVEAPVKSGDVWYSSLIIRSDGMVMTTNRVKVEPSASIAEIPASEEIQTEG